MNSELEQSLIEAEIEDIYLEQAEIMGLAKQDFLAFVCYTKPGYQINWHHRYLCKKLNDFAEGKIKRLMVFMPPRHGKSELVSRRLPAYIMGQNPDAKIIAASYGDSLASSMNRDVQRIMETSEYRSLFPDTQIPDFGVPSRWLRNNDTFEVMGREGSYRCCGVGGSVTGHGGDYAIIDDPIKNADQAGSATYREKTWEWYQSTFLTRLEKNDAILLTLTRWHEDDLAGRLLEQAKNDPEADQWEVISFPAIKERDEDITDIREVGEALWSWKYDTKRLNKIRKAIGTKFWNALYQQSPTALEGNIVKKHWWKFYDSVPLDLDHIWQSWDLTFEDTEKGSFVVGTVWGKKRENYYLIDIFREKCEFTEQLRMVRRGVAMYPDSSKILVENKANGAALISVLKNEIAGLVAVEPHGSKQLRAEAVSPMIESGNVWLPKNKPWVQDFIDEFTNFPNGKNNDQVDSTSQYLFNAKGKISLAEIL